MTRADNTRFLTQAAADRHRATLTKASNAIKHLDSSGQHCAPRHPGQRPSRPPSVAPLNRSARLDTARTEITRLRAENTALREQAARNLGEQRAAIHPIHPQ